MKSIAQKRLLVSLMVLSTGTLPVCFPGLACLSGSEQSCLQAAWTGTATSIGAGLLTEAIPQNVPGDGGFLDALWNGGVEWSIGLLQQSIDTCLCRGNNCIPVDPFPFPTSEIPPCPGGSCN